MRYFLLYFVLLSILLPAFAENDSSNISASKNREQRIKELKAEKRRLERKLSSLSYDESTDLVKDIEKDTNKELRRDKKETKKDLKKIFYDKINQLNEKMKNAETEIEYQALLSEKNQLKKEYFKERKNYRKNVYIAEKVEDDVEEFRSILESLEPDGITFVTNGTRISKQGTEEEYFFDKNKEADSYQYSKEFGSIFKTDVAYFLSWVGQNNDKARRAAAAKFANQIKNYCLKDSMNTGRKPKNIPINLVGHSHGGNIMILVSNHLLKDGYNVQFLFTFNTPRREYVPLYPVNHVQLFSYDDDVQKIGGWDFDFLWHDLDYNGPAGRKFENAININLNYFLDYETYSFYLNDFLKLYKTGKSYHHQITRYLGIIEKIILE